MQYKKLVQALLVVHFAKDSPRPLRSAFLRLFAAYCAALVLGLVCAKALAKADLPPGIPEQIALAAGSLLGFLLAGLLLLSLGAAESNRGASSFQRNIRLMPLRPIARWSLQVLPGLLILGAVAIPLGLVVVTFARNMKLTPVLQVVAITVGLLAGQGFVMLSRPRGLSGKAIVFVGLIAAGLWLLEQTVSSKYDFLLDHGARLLVLAVVLMLSGFSQLYHNGYQIFSPLGSVNKRQLIPKYLPTSSWLFVKLWRNRRTRGSFLLAFGFNLCLAAAIIIKRTVFNDPSDVLLIGGVLAATFACDVRGVMRRYLPPEMVLLNGLKSIVWSQAVAVLVLGLAIGLPMFYTLNSQAINSTSFLLSFVALQSFCSMAGLLASTILVPAQGEVGSQFFSAAIAMGVLTLFLKYARLGTTSLAAQHLCWLVASLILFTFVYITEKIRRSNYGRT